MLIRFASLVLLAATPLAAQAPPQPAPVAPAAPAAPAAPVAPASRPATVRVTLQTSAGPIVLELEKERAPISTANFLAYIDRKKLAGAGFYRATKVAPGYGLIQGGTRNDPKRSLPPIAHEPTSKTGLSHDDGAIAMARAAPGTASGDFFIVVGGFPSMDADPKLPGDNQGFAVFGHVVEGMDVVRQILDAPTDPNAGEGAMKGQMLATPVTITAATRN